MAAPARDQIAEFSRNAAQGVFTNIAPADVVAGLNVRLADPTKIDQNQASLCGPATLMYDYARDKPDDYVKYVLDLYKTGVGSIGKLTVKPGSDCKKYKIPEGKINAVDWIALASLRDSENAFLDYDTVDVETGGITLPGKLKGWYDKAGYATVVDETNVYFLKDKANLEAASAKFAAGYRTHLFVNSEVLSATNYVKSATIPTHWVTLASPVNFLAEDKVTMTVYTWGRLQRIPQTGEMPLKDFIDDYFGYLAARLVATS